MMRLPISIIRLDGGTQPRATINSGVVADYMAAMAGGAEFPPVVVFHDGSNHWLADGFHRIKAAEKAGRDEIACEVHQGTQQDAQWYSFSANKTNGLRRTNQDKQRAVKAALQHPSGAGLSDGQIAQHVGVSDQMVRNYRRRMESTPKVLESTRRKGCDGRTINVARIGKAPEATRPRAPQHGPQGTVPAEPDAEPHDEAPASRAAGRTTRSQKIDRLARLTLSFIEATKHLTLLVGWLGETAGEFDEAELLLSNISGTIAEAISNIERKALAADPLNASRLGIQENKP
jgi:transposase-like protein